MKTIEQIAQQVAEEMGLVALSVFEPFAVKVVEAWQAQHEPVGYVGKHIAHAIQGGSAGLTTITLHMAFYDDVGIFLAPPPAIPEGARKVFICTSCEGVYADEPTSRCDCMPEVESYDEGYIVMLKAAQGEKE